MGPATHHEDRPAIAPLIQKARYQMILKSVLNRLAIFGVEDCQRRRAAPCGAALTNLRTSELSLLSANLGLLDPAVRFLSRLESDWPDLRHHFLRLGALGHDRAMLGLDVADHVVLVS